MTEQTRDRLPAIDDSCWFLTGPTASGKTRAALVLAERIGAEIISLDSMAIYRGMDIGLRLARWVDAERKMSVKERETENETE